MSITLFAPLRSLLIGWAVLCALAASGQCAEPLGGIFCNMPGANFDAVKSTAAAQTTSAPYYKSNAVETRTYEGRFKANSTNTRLAIFSDDGCDVYIDNEKVHGHFKQGQPLPDLNRSLYVLDKTFDPTRSYSIKVDFSNTLLVGDTDIDGVTLFCFGGGGILADEFADVVITCIDKQEDDPEGVTGLEVQSAQPGKVTYTVTQNGGSAETVGFSSNAVQLAGVYGDAIEMPLNYQFAVGNDFHYQITMTVASDGLLDKMDNEFDIDGNPDNGIQGTTTFRFHIVKNGDGYAIINE